MMMNENRYVKLAILYSITFLVLNMVDFLTFAYLLRIGGSIYDEANLFMRYIYMNFGENGIFIVKVACSIAVIFILFRAKTEKNLVGILLASVITAIGVILNTLSIHSFLFFG